MAKALNHIHTCTACGIEFDIKSKKVYTILFDGSLVDHYANEFMDCG